jgi:uncharacterized protein YbcI
MYVIKQLEIATEYNIKGMYVRAGITVFKNDFLGKAAHSVRCYFTKVSTLIQTQVYFQNF